jgi:hypothetical protein
VTKGAFQTTNRATNGTGNAFVTKLNSTGTALLYSTYLGGTGGGTPNINQSGDLARGLALDAEGDAYVVGIADSTDFPTTTGALQRINRGAAKHASNAFVTKLNPEGSALIYSTYLGGSGYNTIYGDGAVAVALDSSRNAVIAGYATSTDFPVSKGAFQQTKHSTGEITSAFLTELNDAGDQIVYSTYLGGSGDDIPSGLAVDESGNAYLAGYTSSIDFPATTGAFQTKNKGTLNGFVSEVGSTGTKLLYSTFLGGTGADGLRALAIDREGNAFVTGFTDSRNFPVTKGAFQPTNHATGESQNALVAKLNLAPSPLVTTTALYASANPQTKGLALLFTAVVKPETGNEIPTGSVEFTVDGVHTSTVALTSTGKADYSTSALTPGVHAIEAEFVGNSTWAPSSASLAETIKLPLAPAPMVEPPPGNYAAAQTVRLSDLAIAGLVIYYTANGDAPTTSSTKYTSAGIKVAATETVKAIAFAPGFSQSAVVTASYTIK